MQALKLPMAQGLNSKGHTASSSSDSSEDEEEAKRISAAIICDERLFKTSQCQGENSRLAPKQNGMLREEALPLKSNRPKDRNDDDNENVLQTTPEFRAYVAKKLCQVLDRDLSNSIDNQVWIVPNMEKSNEEKGIFLFSDSKTRFRLSDSDKKSLSGISTQQSKHVTNSRPRKCRLSTSSESSEDEKINSIVFSVDDIKVENKRLEDLEKKAVDDGKETSKKNVSTLDNGHLNIVKSETVSSQCPMKGKQKKCKKKKTKEKNVTG